jgi:uncharacterized membrane protein YpjA
VETVKGVELWSTTVNFFHACYLQKETSNAYILVAEHFGMHRIESNIKMDLIKVDYECVN